ncbi:MAG: four helix bundle protein [Micavibrio aeruginosavorus]|uniref:Four helix bundle protein n=1 Tax=Micavibrio aeruginosavorus TaxID=349221 RepID=A0A2W5FFR4_9BACT|nr:MAG: four helix bundle protein [Micavibrio aeruginosavorus]
MSYQKKEFAPTFEDLEVFKSSFSIAIEIHKKTLGFPKIEQYALANQIRRSRKAIAANIAEGFGKQRNSKAEFARFIIIAIGSSDETLVWLKFCFELGYISEEEYSKWCSELKKTSRMLQSLYSTLKSDNR